jgi:hypothetical protein
LPPVSRACEWMCVVDLPQNLRFFVGCDIFPLVHYVLSCCMMTKKNSSCMEEWKSSVPTFWGAIKVVFVEYDLCDQMIIFDYGKDDWRRTDEHARCHFRKFWIYASSFRSRCFFSWWTVLAPLLYKTELSTTEQQSLLTTSFPTKFDNGSLCGKMAAIRFMLYVACCISVIALSSAGTCCVGFNIYYLVSYIIITSKIGRVDVSITQ